MRDGRRVHKPLLGKPKRKRPRGRPKMKWEDITWDLKEIDYEDDCKTPPKIGLFPGSNEPSVFIMPVS